MKPKDEKKLQAIFNATLSLTGQEGIVGLTMSKIAKTAKIGIGTLYVYFESKEELVNELYRQLKTGGTLSMIDDLKALPVKPQLLEVWKRTLQYRVENHAQMVFMEQFLNSPFISEESRGLSYQFTAYLTDLLETGQQQMIIKQADEAILMNLLSGYSRQLAAHLVDTKTPLTEKVINESFSLCWDAIKS
ncbi:MAG: TetR/AcrR family transcriptional regulator [Roseivirga sp.]|nr:TetR/AcrR family transcriptional regulator [Roseivirga sp.]